MEEMDSLYDGMDRDNRAAFRKLWVARFVEVAEYLAAWSKEERDSSASLRSAQNDMSGGNRSAQNDMGGGNRSAQKDRLRGLSSESAAEEAETLADLYLYNLLEKPSAVTGYAYGAEVLRKRDRAEEAILAAPLKIQKQRQFERHIKYWSRQTGWYVDMASDDGARAAMVESGIQRVMWVSMRDRKVCGDCYERDGRIYSIDEAPGKHPGCRCYLIPIG